MFSFVPRWRNRHYPAPRRPLTLAGSALESRPQSVAGCRHGGTASGSRRGNRVDANESRSPVGHEDRIQQRRMQAIRPDHQQAIEVPQSHAPRVPAAQHGELLAQEEILSFNPRTSGEPRPQSKQQLG